jgi:glycogen synthase
MKPNANSIVSTPIAEAIAVVTIESQFFPWGGIAPVLSRLPHHLAQASGLPTFCITPWFDASPQLKAAEQDGKTKWVSKFTVGFEGEAIPVELARIEVEQPFAQTWFLLRPETNGFFCGKRHPFDEPPDSLLRDALFFGAATADALRVIAPHGAWKVSLHDWEAATTALALADRPDIKARCWLTLHNVFDFPVSEPDLRQAAIIPSLCPGDSGQLRATILRRVAPLVERDIFAVSNQFAEDIFKEPLQRLLLADHLQTVLAGRMVGANNGPFISKSVPVAVVDSARVGNSSLLLRWKTEQRRKFFAAIGSLPAELRAQVFGDPAKYRNDEDAVLVVMGGRADPSQRGFDVMAAAANELMKSDRNVQFAFFPMPGEEGIDALDFLRALAEKHPEQVLVLPFRHIEAYQAAIRGATYVVMPSIYEPFGSANEAPLNGSVAIVRATGGLLEQVVPVRDARCATSEVLKRSSKWHSAADEETGYIYREVPIVFDSDETEKRTWQTFVDEHRLEAREKMPLFQGMATALLTALEDAATLWRTDRNKYGKLVAAGVDLAERSLSWARTAEIYTNAFSR